MTVRDIRGLENVIRDHFLAYKWSPYDHPGYPWTGKCVICDHFLARRRFIYELPVYPRCPVFRIVDIRDFRDIHVVRCLELRIVDMKTDFRDIRDIRPSASLDNVPSSHEDIALLGFD